MRGLLWVGGLLAGGVAMWLLIRDPGTRFVGLLALAAVLSIVGAFVGPMYLGSADVRAMMQRSYAPPLLVVAAGCIFLGLSALIGSLERDGRGYVAQYGSVVTVVVPHSRVCEVYGDACVASWERDGQTVQGKVDLSSYQQSTLKDSSTDPDGGYRFLARALGDRAVSFDYGAKPASSVLLGRIPAWLGWATGPLGLLLAAFAMRPGRPRAQAGPAPDDQEEF